MTRSGSSRWTQWPASREMLDARVRDQGRRRFRQPGAEIRVPVTPDHERRRLDARPGGTAPVRRPADRAVVVQRCRQRARAGERDTVALDVVVGEGLGPGIGAEARAHEALFTPAQQQLRDARHLECRDVRAPPQLGGISKRLAEASGVRRVDDDQPLDEVRTVHPQRPRRRTAPVVRHDGRADGTKVPDHRREIPGDRPSAVRVDPARLVGEVVAAEIERHGAKPGLGQRGQLPAPRVPEVREAVDEDDQRPVAGLDRVQSDAAIARDKALRHRDRHGLDRGHDIAWSGRWRAEPIGGPSTRSGQQRA